MQKQRDRSNLGGALAPPKPWEPRTRGKTLLPSREQVKEEEEEGEKKVEERKKKGKTEERKREG